MGKNQRQDTKKLVSWRSYFPRRFLFGKYPKLEKLADDPYLVLRLLLAGSMIFLLLILALLLISFILLGNSYVGVRVVLVLAALLYVAAARLLLKKRPRFTAYMLLGLYGFTATLAVTLWGITVPFGLLIFGFLIVLAGVTLGSSYALVAGIGVIAILAFSQMAVELDLITPDRSPVMLAPNFGDVAGFGTAFLILALIAWLSGRQMEQSLAKAREAEAALLSEKQNLARKLEERTQKLRAAQLQEMQQLYRFAELGQLSTALLHDLANHLTVLTLDIEDMQKERHSQAIKRAKKSMLYLDKMVDQVRTQIQGTSYAKRFSLSETINHSVQQLAHKARMAQVAVELDTASTKSEALECYGDPVRLQQIVTILLANAIDAYKHSKANNANKRVLISIKELGKNIQIRVQDWGSGIPVEERSKLFKPFYSTKNEGMGIGLFIAKQMAETHFKGTLLLSKKSDCTEFVVEIPKLKRHEKPDNP